MHNGAIASPNQRPPNDQNLAPGRTHRSSSSARTTQNPPVSTTAGYSANFIQAFDLERWQREQDLQHRGHTGIHQQELSRRERENRRYESARGGSKRSRDSDAGNERRKYPRGDYSSRRNR